MADRVATAGIVADPRKLDGGLKRAESRFQRFGRNIKRSVGRSIKGAFSGLSTLGGFATVGGLAIVGRQVLDFESKLNRLQIQSGSTGAEIGRFRNQLNAMSRDTGISRKSLIDGAEALVNLQGKAGFSAKQLEVLADASLATGTQMTELAGLAFSLGNSFGLADPASLEKGLSAIITAGKEGAVPLSEMSLVLQQVGASFKDIGGVGVGAAADMAAALQILRRGFGTAAEAGTGLQALITGLTKKSGPLKKLGVDVFEDGKFRNLRLILDDFDRADLTFKQLVDTMGRVEGAKGLKTLLEFRREKGGQAGFEELAEAARQSDAVAVDSAARRQSEAFKIEKAFNDVKLALADAFTPERLKTFVTIVQKLAGLLKWMVDNPLKSMAAMFALKTVPGSLGGILTGRAIVSGLAKSGGGAAGGSAVAGVGARAAAGVGGRAAAGAGAAAISKGFLGTTGGAFGGAGVAAGAGLVAAAGLAGFAFGTAADKVLGLSDLFAGVDDTTANVEKFASKLDPTGQAAKLRAKAEQQREQGFFGTAAATRERAVKIEQAEARRQANERQARKDAAAATKKREFEFKTLFGGGEGSIAARLAGQGKFKGEQGRLALLPEELQQIGQQLVSGPRSQARAFAGGAPISLGHDPEGKLVILVKVEGNGNVTAENSPSQRRGG